MIKQAGGQARDNALFNTYDLLILHVDADVAGKHYDSAPIARISSSRRGRLCRGQRPGSGRALWRLAGRIRGLREGAGVLDLSFRGRLCVLGADAQRFLNGQVTNNVKDLQIGEGCYAALVSAKGKLHSDLNIYRLENEMLLDFEPGLSEAVAQRLEKFVIAEDAQVINAAPDYGLWSVQGPKAAEVVGSLSPRFIVPPKAMGWRSGGGGAWRNIRDGTLQAARPGGLDLFVPAPR
jgi:hypothetical protein